ncbi:MAG: phosphoribosylaminoimidazolesuccinocarboxamide synthase [Candidatus Wildermuthbacteria bacterium]|nr:phosphoribosylaminoimidazolesuccinocarboxamide synthase [Candidatus Wildermuthbacteria bacterium]
MAVIPEAVRETETSRRIEAAGLKRVYQGKVRDTYKHPRDPRKLVVVATDRISIFDVVLPTPVPQKGAVLTALTHFWLTCVLANFRHHLLTFPFDRAEMVHSALPVKQTLVVWKLPIVPFEMIFRGHIGGSVWVQYQETGMVAGRLLPPDLAKWQQLDFPIFTPSTKAEEGHDANITVQEFFENTEGFGERAASALQEAYELAYAYARRMGILILDTKFEIGLRPGGQVVIADEVLTPDSSRFTTMEDLEKALKEGRDPVFYDKEPVRNWGRTVDTPAGRGINLLDPKNPEHLAFVASLEVPREIMEQTTERYLDIFQRLTGMSLEQYQKERMGL